MARGALSEDRGGEGVPSHYERGGMVRGPVPHSSVYHMGTISRANKHNQDPAHQEYITLKFQILRELFIEITK